MAIVPVSDEQYQGIVAAFRVLRETPGFNADQFSLHLQADPRYVPYRHGSILRAEPYDEAQAYSLNRSVERYEEATGALRDDPSLYSAQMAAQIDAIFDRWGVVMPTASDIAAYEAPPVLPPAPEPMLPLWNARGDSITAYGVEPRIDFNTAAQVPTDRPLTINDVPQYWISDDVARMSRPVYDPQNLDQMRVVFQYMSEHPQSGALSTLSMESMAYNLLHPDRYEQTRVMVEQIASGQPLPTLTDMFPNMRMLSAEEFEIERLRQVCSGQSGFFSWDTVECAAHRVSNFAYNAGLGVVSAVPSGLALIVDGVDNVPRLWGGETISGRETLLAEDVHSFMQGHYDNAIGVIGLERPLEIDNTDYWFGMAGLVAPALFTGGAAGGSVIARGVTTILPNAGRVITPTVAGVTVVGAEVASAGVVIAGDVVNAPRPLPTPELAF